MAEVVSHLMHVPDTTPVVVAIAICAEVGLQFDKLDATVHDGPHDYMQRRLRVTPPGLETSYVDILRHVQFANGAYSLTNFYSVHTTFPLVPEQLARVEATLQEQRRNAQQS